MYCRKCGKQNDDNSYKCVQCGEFLQQEAPTGASTSIPNYLVQSILVTLFCCLPFGIPAIVYAAGVNGKIQAGDIKGAMAASAKARMWCWISFGLGIIFVPLYILGEMGKTAGN
ncbi:CD225/dispanin family protein [Candidatus Saccharibacteria bacterium]|nr:CD225/dispanin family protein [Candidatus Saccharibacteria bacterium]